MYDWEIFGQFLALPLENYTAPSSRSARAGLRPRLSLAAGHDRSRLRRGLRADALRAAQRRALRALPRPAALLRRRPALRARRRAARLAARAGHRAALAARRGRRLPPPAAVPLRGRRAAAARSPQRRGGLPRARAVGALLRDRHPRAHRAARGKRRLGPLSVPAGPRALRGAGAGARAAREGEERRAGGAVVRAVGQRGGEAAAGGSGGRGRRVGVQLHGGAHEVDESERVEVLDRGELSAQRVRLPHPDREEHVRVPGEAPQRSRAEQRVPEGVKG